MKPTAINTLAQNVAAAKRFVAERGGVMDERRVRTDGLPWREEGT